MASFALFITCAHTEHEATQAWAFADEILKAGHELRQVFFFSEGAYHASSLITFPQDAFHLIRAWQDLARQANIPLYACVASALKRGIISEEEAKNYALPAANLAEGFKLVGLGQFAVCCGQVDKVMQFGSL